MKDIVVTGTDKELFYILEYKEAVLNKWFYYERYLLVEEGLKALDNFREWKPDAEWRLVETLTTKTIIEKANSEKR